MFHFCAYGRRLLAQIMHVREVSLSDEPLSVAGERLRVTVMFRVPWKMSGASVAHGN